MVTYATKKLRLEMRVIEELPKYVVFIPLSLKQGTSDATCYFIENFGSRKSKFGFRSFLPTYNLS